MNKDSGGDGIPTELFQILKDDSVKVLHSVMPANLELSCDLRTEKYQFPFHSQRRALPKNFQTTVPLYIMILKIVEQEVMSFSQY